MYWSYYPHRSRELVSPACGIFFCFILPCPSSEGYMFLNFYIPTMCHMFGRDVNRLHNRFGGRYIINGLNALYTYVWCLVFAPKYMHQLFCVCVFNMAFAPKGKAMFLMPPIKGMTHSASNGPMRSLEKQQEQTCLAPWWTFLLPW